MLMLKKVIFLERKILLRASSGTETIMLPANFKPMLCGLQPFKRWFKSGARSEETPKVLGRIDDLD